MTAALSLPEADLHGLVDGYLDPVRRAEALRRLAASPADRTRVDSWQEQNDLIQSAFAGIDKEMLPPSMRLVAPPALHCVPAPVASLRAPTARPGIKQGFGALVTVLLVVGIFGGIWWLVQPADDGPQIVDLHLRGSLDESLAALTAGAVAADAGAPAPKPVAATADGLATPLPTTSIPDLTQAGFIFTSAETRASAPSSIVFHYRSASADHLVVSVARAPQTGADSAPTWIGRTYSWHRGDNAFAIAGTVRPERLRAIASLLQSTELDE